jgi:hypothetical protein
VNKEGIMIKFDLENHDLDDLIDYDFIEMKEGHFEFKSDAMMIIITVYQNGVTDMNLFLEGEPLPKIVFDLIKDGLLTKD